MSNVSNPKLTDNPYNLYNPASADLDYVSLFQTYLFSQADRLSEVSIKNYLSDVKKFLSWHMISTSGTFSPQRITPSEILAFKQSLAPTDYRSTDNVAISASVNSVDRYMSSLRKFFIFLKATGYTTASPFDSVTHQEAKDAYYMLPFKNHLYLKKASYSTIKNYMTDIQLFLFWLRTTHPQTDKSQQLEKLVNKESIIEYRNRLSKEGLSTATINRRLSSIRMYVAFLGENKIIQWNPIGIPSIPYSSRSFKQPIATEKPSPTYSRIPPVRFFQRIIRLLSWLYITGLIGSLVTGLIYFQYLGWIISGKRIFVPVSSISPSLGAYLIDQKQTKWTRHRLMSPEFFSVEQHVSPLITNSQQKKQTVSRWLFIDTHRQALAIVSCLLLLGTGGSYIAMKNAATNKQVLAAETSQRLISFQGLLQDENRLPITKPTDVRFSLYNDATASKSALLWQAVKKVAPQPDGSFQITLGDNQPLPGTLFSDNAVLFLGTTVAQNTEFRPRQEIPLASLASNARELNGMHIVNDTSGVQRNVILALDSSGDMQIAHSSPAIRATDGTLTLSGVTTIITTNDQTNGNIVLSPNGFGAIDAQKPLVNTTQNGTIPGAVEVDDQFAIVATTSGQAALQISQNYTGDLISASNSGLMKFAVSYLGAGTFASDLAVNGNYLTSTSPSFHLLDNGPLDVSFAHNASTISIGSMSGTLTINNATTALNGDLQFTGPNNHTISTSQGTLSIANAILASGVSLDKDVSIVPLTTDGTNNLGSNDRPFDTLYVNNISSPNNFTVNGKLGVGNSSPNFKLDVSDTQDATVAAFINNLSTAVNASALAVKLGGTSLQTSNHFMDFLDGNGNIQGSIQANGNGGVSFQTSGIADFAEYMPKHSEENIATGALVCFLPDGNVTQCTQAHATLAGVISNHPTIVAGKNTGDNSIIVGFTGQLPMLVSTQNGSILPGDPISASSIPGVGVKATTAGPIIGHALEAYTNANPYVIGTVLAVEQPSWIDPNVTITDAGNLSIQMLQISQPQQDTNPIYQLLSSIHGTITATAHYSQAWIANLTTGIITTQQIVVANSATFLGTLQAKSITAGQIAADTILLSGVNLQDYISQQIKQSISHNAIADSSSITHLSASVISPIGTDSAVLVAGNLNIIGDASTSGRLTSDSLQTTDATISGTLSSHKIMADEIELNGHTLSATSSSTYITNVTNVYATPSATPTLQEALVDASIATPTATPTEQFAHEPITLPSNTINIASFSGLLASIPGLNLQTATITQGFMSTGTTSLSDTAISGQLAIDGNLILSNGAINVIGVDLSLQPLRQGGVNFLDGLFVIDASGNVNVKGNASFAQNVSVKGTLSTNVISPLADGNLNVQLGTNSGVLVSNASNSAVLHINQSGDVASSGSGNFAQVITNALQIVHGAQADTSITQTIASSSAGTAIIYKGQLERTIVTPFVKPTSLIYISLTSNTAGVAPYVARQTTGDCTTQQATHDPSQCASFTIQVPSRAISEIHMNWWIVN